MYRKRWKVPEILSLRIFPMRRIIEAGSGSRRCRKGTYHFQCKKTRRAESVYENYYEFDEPVNRLAGYRTLALNRGEKEKFLTVKIEAPQEDILRYLEKKIIHGENLSTTQILKEAIEEQLQATQCSGNRARNPR